MGLEDDFLLADADDEKTIEYIKNYLKVMSTLTWSKWWTILLRRPRKMKWESLIPKRFFLWYREKWNMETLWGK